MSTDNMFNPYASTQPGAARPLPQRPHNPLLDKIQEAAAQAAAAEEPVAALAATQPWEQPHVAAISNNPPEEISMIENIPAAQGFDAPFAGAAQPDVDAPALAQNSGVADGSEDVRTVEDLPAKAGIIDYRQGDGLPSLMSAAQAAELAGRLDGISIASTFPVEHREALKTKEGTPRMSKAGKQMFKKVSVPTNVSVLVSGAEHLGFVMDEEYAVRLVAEQMIWRVQGHMAAQGVSIREGWMFDQDWLSKHFGTTNLMEAVEAELRPWAATKVSALSAATQQAMCSSVTDAEEIISIYDTVEKAASAYLSKLLKGTGSKAQIAQQLAPITKAKAKWEQYVTRSEKATAEGKAAPKPPVIKALTAETPKGIRAVAGVLLTAESKRQAMTEKFKAGNYPARFSEEEVAEYINGTLEYSIQMQTVSCWLQQIATTMQATEQRKLQKYAADSTAAAAIEDDFDLI